MKKNSINNKDYIIGIKKISDNSVNLVITDPPYNLNKDFGNDSDKQTPEEYILFTKKWLNECYRVLKSGGKLIFTFSQVGIFDMKKIIEETEFNFIQVLIWHYGNITNVRTGGLYVRNYEPIFILSKNKPNKLNRIKGISTCDVLKYTKPQSNFKKDKRIHPTQKPLELFKRLIIENSIEGDLILDPFAGVGTTAVASKSSKRDFICFELNKKYCELSKIRLVKLKMESEEE